MDTVLASTLRANLKSAKTSDEKLDALVLSEIAMIDCQRKTSDRVKKLVEDVEVIKADLKPCKQSDRIFRADRAKVIALRWIAGVLWTAATGLAGYVALVFGRGGTL